MPNHEHIQKWIDALLSGKYDQAEEALRTEDGYCCLGVACDLYHQETGDGEWDVYEEGPGIFSFRFKVGEETSSAWLPFKVAEWLLGEREVPRYYLENPKIIGEEEPTLAALNDAGHEFDYIAEVIKRNYLEEPVSAES